MSQDNLVKFLARIGNTPELHGKCKDGITAVQLIELGAENGFVFDLDDLRDGPRSVMMRWRQSSVVARRARPEHASSSG